LIVALCLLVGLSLAMAPGGADRAGAQGKKPGAKETKRVITPELDRCTLDVAGRTVKPVRTSLPNLADRAAGGLRIRVEGATVRAFRAGEEKPTWVAKAPGEAELVWLAADKKVIYLSGYLRNKRSNSWRPESPVRVRRLELRLGKWLSDLTFGGKPGPRQTESVAAALASDAHVVVLTATTEDEEGWEGRGPLVSYRVSCFKASEARPLWSKSFRSAGKVGQPGAVLLWATGAPAKVRPEVQPLSWLGRDVLVCAGPVQDLLCLEGGTGKQRWRVERVWEYERGFIGPSEWRHFFRRASGGDEGKKGKKREKAEKWPAARHHSIVGGPVVVDVPWDRHGGDEQRIFVAVAKGPSSYGEYLSDCVVYELGPDGTPLAMANLPRMVRGGQYHRQKGGVVWACEGGAFVKVGATRHSMGLPRGLDRSDLLCRVDWYRQISPEEPEAWLTAAPAGDPVAFGEAVAFRACAGGYVTSPDAGAYRFPLSMIDLSTGGDRVLVLSVPYKGKVPEPKDNSIRIEWEKGKYRWQTRGPHVLAITWLEVEGNRLRVTLGMEEWSRSLEFEINKLRGRKPE
jgi:hypothetical protein